VWSLLGVALCVTLLPAELSAQNAPVSPSDVTFEIILDNAIDVIWQDNSDNEDAFDIFRSENDGDFILLGAVDANLTRFADRSSGLRSGNTYCYRVFARNFFGRSLPAEGCLTIPFRPASPGGLRLTQSADDQPIQISWDDNSDIEDGFFLYRDRDGSGFFLFETTDTDKTTAEDKDLRIQGTYCYFVSAFNVAGESAPSDTECLNVTSGVPTLPRSVSVSRVNGTNLRLSWSLPVFNYTTLRIERADSVQGLWSEILSTSELLVTYLDQALDPASEYCYRLETVNTVGSAGVTDPVCAFTEFGLPPAPTELQATGTEDGSIRISWLQEPSPRVLFELQRREDDDRFRLLADSLTQTSYLDEGLSDDLVFCYRVRSFNPQFASEFSEVACSILAPASPVNLAILPAPGATTSSLFVSWQGGEGTPADAYQVQFRASTDVEFGAPFLVQSENATLADLEDASLYIARVRSVRSLNGQPAASIWIEGEGLTLLSFWPGDVNGDGSVTAEDVVMLLGPACYDRTTSFTTTGTDVSWMEIPVEFGDDDPAVLRCDADRNGVVEIFDFLAIAANAGKSTDRAGEIQPAYLASEVHRDRVAALTDRYRPSPDDLPQRKLKQRLLEILSADGESLELPDAARLVSVYPNPSAQSAAVVVGLPREVDVHIDIVDGLGRTTSRLHTRRLGAGIHRLPFRTEQLPSGFYVLRLSSPDGISILPFTVAR
jgi:hypothetical protein